MARRTTAEGMELNAFAAHIGKTPQWARKLRRENAPEWQQFLATKGKAKVPASAREPVQASHTPLNDLERARQAKEMAWELYCAAVKAAKKGSAALSEQVALNRAAREAREAHEKASKHAATLEQQARQWIPIAEVLAMRAGFRALEDVAQSLETTIAGNMPDGMRPAFHLAFEKARQAWNAGVLRAEKEFESRFPQPC